MKNKNIVVVQNLLRNLPLAVLKDAEVVANLVRAFGIMDWGHTSGPEARFIGQGATLGQTPDQIAKLLVYMSAFKLDSFCEIGIYYGANFLFCSEYLRRFNPGIQCLGIDPTGLLDDEILIIINTEMWLIHKSVTSDEIKGQAFDFVFIDAEHNAPWPKKDYENLGQYAKFCAFHDLQEPLWPDVGVLWETLKKVPGKAMVEFLDDPSEQKTHGIGLIYNKEQDTQKGEK